MPRIGTMRCPCCRAKEDVTVLRLTFTCVCRTESCHRCHKCLSHCACEVPLTWRDFLLEKKHEATAQA